MLEPGGSIPIFSEYLPTLPTISFQLTWPLVGDGARGQVYECEYQEYAIQYMSECTSNFQLLDIPFFPAPDAAPDSCSCNLGNLYLAVNASGIEGATCITNVGEDALGNVNSDPITVSDKQAACTCCGESGAISACVTLPSHPDLAGLSTVEVYVWLFTY